MNRIIVLVFLLLALCLNADNFEHYTEVSEPPYALVYEANGLYYMVKDRAVSVEDGKYKVIDDSLVTYLEIKNSELNGKVFIFDKKTNKKLYENSYKNGQFNGECIDFDSNEIPKIIENYNEGVLLKRRIFSEGKFQKEEVFN